MRKGQCEQNLRQEQPGGGRWLRGSMFLISALLLAGYLYVLYLSFHPRVTEDYRMRYLEEGYFYGDTEQEGQEQARGIG